MELSAARRLNLGPADEVPLAGDVCDPHDAAGDWHLDVVAASPDRPARPAPPRGRCPPRVAGRHHYRDQYFATGPGPLGGSVAGRRAARGAIAEAVNVTANTVYANQIPPGLRRCWPPGAAIRGRE